MGKEDGINWQLPPNGMKEDIQYQMAMGAAITKAFKILDEVMTYVRSGYMWLPEQGVDPDRVEHELRQQAAELQETLMGHVARYNYARHRNKHIIDELEKQKVNYSLSPDGEFVLYLDRGEVTFDQKSKHKIPALLEVLVSKEQSQP